MRIVFGFLCLIVLQTGASNSSIECPNNCSGSDNGRCTEDGTCSCLLLRSGEDCSGMNINENNTTRILGRQ